MSEREMREMRQELAELRRQIAARPVVQTRFTAAPAITPGTRMAAIIGGQTLTSRQGGIKRVASNLTTATLYDPNHTDRAAWVTATTYVAGDIVSRSSNSYICTTGGTSSGGPSGTGTGIADGTCVWDWYGGNPSLPLSPDGLGIGYLWANNAQQFITVGVSQVPQKVMIVLDPRSIVPFAVAAGEWVRLADAPVQVGATANIVAYPATFV